MKKTSLWYKIKCRLRMIQMKFQGYSSGERQIHAYRAKGVIVGDGSYIYDNVHISTASIGEVTIGKNCVLTGCSLIAHDASTKKYIDGAVIASPIVIKDGAFIGFNSVVLRGVTIGENAIVGAGAIVTKDVPDNMVVAGNPAKVVCTVEELISKHKKELG